jgi:hypothetical protein
MTIFVFVCKTGKSKPVKQEVNGTGILPPLVFPVKSVGAIESLPVLNCLVDYPDLLARSELVLGHHILKVML